MRELVVKPRAALMLTVNHSAYIVLFSTTDPESSNRWNRDDHPLPSTDNQPTYFVHHLTINQI